MWAMAEKTFLQMAEFRWKINDLEHVPITVLGI
jgi:hypothetical protein